MSRTPLFASPSDQGSLRSWSAPRARRFSLANPIEAIGSVTFHGSAGDSAAGWTIGFVQTQWVETNWGIYRGAAPSDGSVFVQRARPPSRPHQACFDSSGGPLFYGALTDPLSAPIGGGAALPFVRALPPHATFPLTIDVIHRDYPGDSYLLSRTNSHTHRPNRLQEVQLEFSFCVALIVRSPGNGLRLLKALYWNVNWQDRFHQAGPTHATVATPRLGGNMCNVGGIIEGRPTDPRFISVLTKPQATTCNAVAGHAAAHPNLKEVTGWPEFDVRH